VEGLRDAQELAVERRRLVRVLAVAHVERLWPAPVEALAVARDVWTPGLGLTSDAVVEKVLSRFHSHRIRTTIAQMAVENSEMASRLARALECLKFYAARRADAGAYARSILAALNLPPRRVDSPDPVPDRFLVRKRGG